MKSIANKVVEALMPILPPSWRKVCLFYSIDKDYYSAEYYVYQDGIKEPISSAEIRQQYGYSILDLDNSYGQIYSLLSKLRNSIEKKGDPFYHYYLSFDREQYKEDFDYRYDPSEDEYDGFMKEWRTKYLNGDPIQ